jgi:hypothetical protein
MSCKVSLAQALVLIKDQISLTRVTVTGTGSILPSMQMVGDVGQSTNRSLLSRDESLVAMAMKEVSFMEWALELSKIQQ